MATRRGNGEGTIYKRKDGPGYRAQLIINGRRRSFTAATKTEVREKLEIAKVDALRGNYIQGDTTTLEEWGNKWLEMKSNYLRPQSYIKIEKQFTNHVYPQLGKCQVQKLNRGMIERFYLDVLYNPKTGKKYSRSHIEQLHTNLNACLNYAVVEGLLQKNPHIGAKVPEGEPQKEAIAYSVEEQAKITSYLKENMNMAFRLLLFLLYTGVRVGEAAALKWEDVSLNNKTVRIHRTRLQNGVIQELPKTKKSLRTITMADTAVKFLKEIKPEDAKPTDFVFPNSKGNSYSDDSLRKQFARACAIIEVPYYNGVHVLRHTWATRALELGIQTRIVSEMLGHESEAITSRIYQSVLRPMQDKAAETMNSLLERCI